MGLMKFRKRIKTALTNGVNLEDSRLVISISKTYLYMPR